MFMPALTWTRYKSFNLRLFSKVFVSNEQTVRTKRSNICSVSQMSTLLYESLTYPHSGILGCVLKDITFGTPTGQFTPLDNLWSPHTQVQTLPPSTKLWFSHRWSVVRQLLGLRQGSPLGRRCNLCLGKTAACLKLSTHNSWAAAALRHLVTSMPKIRHWTTFLDQPREILKLAQKKTRLVWIHLAERLTGLWKHIQVEMLAKTAVYGRQSVVRAEGRPRQCNQLCPLRTLYSRPQKDSFLLQFLGRQTGDH